MSTKAACMPGSTRLTRALHDVADDALVLLAFYMELGEDRAFEQRHPGLPGVDVDYDFVLHVSPTLE